MASSLTPGDVKTYTDDNNVVWGATVINTFTEDNEDMVTVSITGKGEVLVVKETDLV